MPGLPRQDRPRPVRAPRPGQHHDRCGTVNHERPDRD
jgi:hypothetical protein